MAPHSSVLAWRIPGMGESQRIWWAAVYGVAQSQTRLKRLSSMGHLTQSSQQSYEIGTVASSLLPWRELRVRNQKECQRSYSRKLVRPGLESTCVYPKILAINQPTKLPACVLSRFSPV